MKQVKEFIEVISNHGAEQYDTRAYMIVNLCYGLLEVQKSLETINENLIKLHKKIDKLNNQHAKVK